MKNLVIFGADDMAQVIAYMFENDSDYHVAAFTVDKAYRDADEFCRLPLCDFETVQDIYPPDRYEIFIAMGYSRVNQAREEKYHQAKEKGYRLAKYISSRASCYLSLDDIGDNTFIFENNVVQPFVKIGSNVILWSGNHIGHHTVIGNHVFISSHVVLCGRAEIGDYCFLGVNSTVHDHVKVAERCVIGSCALITRDTEAGGVYKAPYTPKSEKRSNDVRYFKGKSHENN